MNNYPVTKVIEACEKTLMSLNHLQFKHEVMTIKGVLLAARARQSDLASHLMITNEDMYLIGDAYIQVQVQVTV